MKKLIAIMLLLAPFVSASIPMDKQIEIMMSARQADIAEYCYTVGVCVEDKPAMHPFFTSLRVAMCRKHVAMYEGAKVILPCFATFADYISERRLSHMNRAWQGIRDFNAGNMQLGRQEINANIAGQINYS